MPAVSTSQQRLFAMADQLQKGRISPHKASPQVRRLARQVSSTDIGHFAATKHDGLPQHVKAAGKGFFHAMRAAQSGKALKDVSPDVQAAAKRHIPKDATETKVSDIKTADVSEVSYTAQPNMSAPPEVSSKLSSFQLACRMNKVASIHTIMSKSHKAVHQVGAVRREVLAKEVERLRSHNEKLMTDAKNVEQKGMDAAKKLHMAEMHAAKSDMTLEQLQNMTVSQRNPPPPEQPAYGAMLTGQQPGQPAQPTA